MWKTITPSEMKRVENRAMENQPVTGEALMSRAAAAVARSVQALWKQRGGMVVALCGTGNNGGDAIAALRILTQDEGIRGACWILDGELSPDAQRELNRLRRERPHVPVRRLMSDERYAESGVLTDTEGQPAVLDMPVGCLIDGLFGTGLSRPVSGTAAALCRLCRQAYDDGVPVVAVDIPSGLCGCTGQPLGECVKATETVTFHRPKPGLFLGQGLEWAGHVTVADIGLQPRWDDADGLWVAQPGDVEALLPLRSRTGHKGDHGRVALFCGSRGMAGAAAIAATAALRSGAGLVTVACPERILDTVQMLCPCATCLPLEADAETAWRQLEPLLESADALGMGCGLGQSPWAQFLTGKVLAWLSAHEKPAVIDADGLNLLAKLGASGLELSRCVLTPHPGEASRLLGVPVAEVITGMQEYAAELHRRYGAAVVLKGAASVLVTGEGAAVNVLGTPAMGKGGSGDALTGVLCALLGQRARCGQPEKLLSVLQEACGLHGLAGCAAEKRFGSRGVLATDLCEYLGVAAAFGREEYRRETDGVRAQEAVRTGSLLSAGAEATNALIPPAAVPVGKDDETASAVAGRNSQLSEPDAEPAVQRPSASDLFFAQPLHWSDSVTGDAKGIHPGDALGRMVTVTVDRKLGETHPEHKDIVYSLNYGYVQDVLAEDNEWQDAYIYGETLPLDVFEGQVVAVIHRLNDVEDKWVVADPGTRLTREQVWAATRFVEQYFDSEIFCL